MIKDTLEHLILIKFQVLPIGWTDDQGGPRAPDPYQILCPTHGMDRRSRMPLSTWSSSNLKSYLRDKIDDQGIPRALGPHQISSPT
nr:hypothetical protein CFP56_17143 [Quercus suber]